MAVAALRVALNQLLPCYTVGKLHPKPHTAKIQSAITICGGYLGHSVPRKKGQWRGDKNEFMQPDNNKEYNKFKPSVML